MQKKNKTAVVARGAWRFLRLALLWARKGGILKNRLVLAKHFIKTIRNSNHGNEPSAIGYGPYGERELSFDDTPIIHIKMHRPSSLRFKMPNIPCINPPVLDFDYDFGPKYWDDDEQQNEEEVLSRKSFLRAGPGDDEEEEEEEEEVCEERNRNSPSRSSFDEEGIDMKAEEFIAKFYQQMKLQRQISYLLYNEMISRGAN